MNRQNTLLNKSTKALTIALSLVTFGGGCQKEGATVDQKIAPNGLEAIFERLDIKHKVFSWVAANRKAGSIVSSNTSGLSLSAMAEPMSDEAKTDKTEAASQEPSMEDILTSIRRILSEEGGEETDRGDAAIEETAPAEAPSPLPEPSVPSEPPSPSEPDSAMTEIDTAPEQTPGPEPEPEPEHEIALEDTEPVITGRATDNVLLLTPQMRVPLVSPTAAMASTDVLNQLARAILDRRDMAIGNRDVTLEGMVREMLRPLLKEWLDRNLPYLIERLVKKEIDLMINRAERLED